MFFTSMLDALWQLRKYAMVSSDYSALKSPINTNLPYKVIYISKTSAKTIKTVFATL